MALKAKSNIYLSDDWSGKTVEDFVEPIINELLITKKDVANSTDNIYSDNLTMDEYVKLPYKENILGKSEYFRTQEAAINVANRTGGFLIETELNGETMWKVSIPRPPVDNASDDLLIEEEEIDVPEHIENVLKTKYDLVQTLKKKLAEKSPRAAEIKAKISTLEKQIENLTKDHTSETLKNIAATDINIIQNNLNEVREKSKNELTPEEILKLIDAINEASYYIKGWNEIYQYFSEEDVAQFNQIRGFSDRLARLNKDYNKLSADLASRYFNTESYRDDITPEELTEATTDISSRMMNFHSMSEAHIPILKLLDGAFRQTANKINTDFASRKAEISKQFDLLVKHTSKSRSEISDIFNQEYKDGSKTGNFIGRYNQEFYDERRTLRKEAEKTKAWTKYNNWLSENVDNLTSKQLSSINKLTVEELNKKSDDFKIGVFTKAEILNQKQLLSQYYVDKNSYIDMSYNNDENFSTGELTKTKNGTYEYTNKDTTIEQQWREDIATWEYLNSPYSYIKDPKGKSGFKYVIREKPKKQHEDPRYSSIEKDPVLYGFYKYMRDTFHDNNRMLPYINNLQYNYLPEVKLSLWEQMKSSSWKNKFQLLRNDIRTGITDEVAQEEDNRAHIGNKDLNSIPVTMMAGKLSVKNKNMDIFTSLEEHSKMSFNYAYKAEIESLAAVSQDLLNDTKEITTVDIDGNPVVRKKRKTANKKGGKLQNAKDLIDFVIGKKLYGKGPEVQGRSGVKINTTNEAGETVEREFTGSNLVQTLNSITYMKLLGFPNIVGPMVNSTFGFVSNMSYASANQDVTETEMLKANMQMISITSKRLGGKINEKLALKTYAFMDRFNLLGDITEGHGNSSLAQKITQLQAKAEFLNQGALMLGILRTQKLTTKDGKEISIFDAYTEKNGELFWNTELMGAKEDVPNNRVISENKNQININSLQLMIRRIVDTVHGDYSAPMKFKDKAIGKAIMMFKTWIPMAVEHRFGGEKTEQDLVNEATGLRGRVTKGRYRSYFGAKHKDETKVLFKETMGLLAKGLLGSKKAFSELNETDRVNLIRNMRELHFIMTLYGTVTMLSMLLEGDDDDDFYQLKILVNMLSKTQADMTFFMNPGSAGQVLDNVVPLMSILNDGARVIDAIGKSLVGNTTFEGGPMDGRNRLLVTGGKFLPVSHGAVKMYTYGSRVFEYK